MNKPYFFPLNKAQRKQRRIVDAKIKEINSLLFDISHLKCACIFGTCYGISVKERKIETSSES